jgi:uncharacterized iron-regulated membrane protein
MRRFLALAHRWIGLGLGLIFFLVCASGSLLVWEDEVTDFLDRSLIIGSSTDSSLALIEKAAEEEIKGDERLVRFYLPPGKVRVQGSQGRRILYFNPNDGTFLGEGSQFMRQVEIFHRRLFLGDPGRWMTLVSATGVIFLVLSGIKLWWPISKKGWGQAFTVKLSMSKRRLLFDVHRVGGVIVALPLLLIVITGWNYSILSKPYRSTILKLTRAPVPSPALRTEIPGHHVTSLDDALAAARLAFPNTELSFVNYPKTPEDLVLIAMRHPWQPGGPGQSTVEFDLSTGKVRRQQNALQMPLGQQFISVWALPIHRGRAFGRPQQVLWALTCFMGMLLPLTGAWLWYCKGKKK